MDATCPGWQDGGRAGQVTVSTQLKAAEHWPARQTAALTPSALQRSCTQSAGHGIGPGSPGPSATQLQQSENKRHCSGAWQSLPLDPPDPEIPPDPPDPDVPPAPLVPALPLPEEPFAPVLPPLPADPPLLPEAPPAADPPLALPVPPLAETPPLPEEGPLPLVPPAGSLTVDPPQPHARRITKIDNPFVIFTLASVTLSLSATV
jgi:hypothetical protein